MTVIRPNSISGVSSITAQGGRINVHRADGTAGDLTINNIIGVAATFSGVLTYEDVTNVDSVGVITARSTVSIADSIVHTGDTNTSLRFPAADTITAETGGLERIRVDSSGRLGIGANNNDSYDTNARNVLIASSGNTGITIRSGGSSNYAMIHFADGTSGSAEQRAGRILYEHSTDSLQFSTANTYAFKIDSGQRLLIGHSITDNRDGFNSAVQIGGTSGDGASMCIGRYSANVSSSNLVLSKSRSATVGGHTRINTGDYIGAIQFQGDDGTRFLVGANIVAQAASPVADYDMATDLIISTNSGTTSPNKSMTLDHQGRFTKPFTPFVMAHINTTSNRNSSGSQLKVPWDVIHGRGTNSNMGSHFNTSNNRFTAPVDGRYLIVLSMNEVGDNIVYHRINNTQVSYAEYRESGTAWDHMDASFIYDMNANDYYETWSLLTGTGQRWNGGGTSNGGWDTLSIYLLG